MVCLPYLAVQHRSIDRLCKTADGREAAGSIASEMGAKIVASAVFIDLGIVDAITDKHRLYAASYVIPVQPRSDHAAHDGAAGSSTGRMAIYEELRVLQRLRDRGVITDAEFQAEKTKLLQQDPDSTLE